MADFTFLPDAPLTPAEIRVLGCLVEKEMTTPDYYPLSVNALTAACNQSSNRDPIVSYDEAVVVRALESLRDKKLAFLSGGGQIRVPRFGHNLADSELGRPEIAVLCVLLLRGPQTVGEVRGRTARMHAFDTLEDAEAVLAALAARPTGPLVVKLPRQPGMKEQRYAHLLGGAPAAAEGPAGAPAADPEPAPRPAAAAPAAAAEQERLARLEGEIASLRAEMADLRREFAGFRKQFE